MALRYGLLENPLHHTHGYIAVTTDIETVNLSQLIDQMTSRGSTVTKAEILGVWEEFEQAVAHYVKQGYAVKTPLFTIKPTVSGIFDNPDDTFDQLKHEVRLNIRTSARLQALSKQIKVEKVNIAQAAPTIASITDLSTGIAGNTLTVGQFAVANGRLLKLSPHPQSGIFLIDHEGSEHPLDNIYKNKPSELMFAVPQNLLPGNYWLEIRTQIKNHSTPSSCRVMVNIAKQ